MGVCTGRLGVGKSDNPLSGQKAGAAVMLQEGNLKREPQKEGLRQGEVKRSPSRENRTMATPGQLSSAPLLDPVHRLQT